EIDLLADSTFRNRLERQRALFNTVVDQLKQVHFVGDFNSISSEVIESAHLVPTSRRPMVVIWTIAAILGCALGVLAAYVAHLFDTRLRSLVELRRVLDLPVLGVIPLIP